MTSKAHSLLHRKGEKWVSVLLEWCLKVERDGERILEARCLLYSNDEDALHILLKCSETTKLREHLLN